jgi:hypothetical protein
MLRSYAAVGLLVPAAVDPWSGYRYYTPSQLAEAGLILLLRQAGVPLSVAVRSLTVSALAARAVAVAGNRQQAFWLLHLLLHAVVTLMLSARPADLPVEVTHPARDCLAGLGRLQRAQAAGGAGLVGRRRWGGFMIS